MSEIKRAVTFYSLQDQYARKKMTLDEIAKFVKMDLGAEMEFIPDQMMHNAPHPSEDTLEAWDKMVEKYQIVPVCCGSYCNDKLYKNRLLTVKEAADKLIEEIKLARRLGFHMVKVVSTTRNEIIETALPTAEKYDVVITSEIHGGMSFNMPYVKDYIKFLERVKSSYVGLTVDTGIFCRRHPRVSTEYFRSLGMNNAYIISYIDDIFRNGSDPNAYFMEHPGKMDEIMDKCSSELERLYVIYATGYDNNPLTVLDEYMPYVKHIHGKVYEMTEEGTEYSIPYEEIVAYLEKKEYDGYISTEYEGNRFTQANQTVAEKEQVTKHQQLLKQLIDKYEQEA